MSQLAEKIDFLPDQALPEGAVPRPSPISTRSGGDFSIRLEYFAGPMDLLLHLVHQRELPICDVNMAEICEQYLVIVSEAALLDLERATEYLVIAATLTAMKSQAMLPPAGYGDEEGAEDEYDPRFFEALRDRLMVYEETKKRAALLNRRAQLGIDTFASRGRSPFPQEEDLRGDAESLGQIFLELLTRIGKRAGSFLVRMESVSVVSFMMKIVDRLSIKRAGSFFQTVAGLEGKTRGAIIGSFIAVLELSKRGFLTTSQQSDGSDIELALQMTEGLSSIGEAEMTSEFDDEKVLQMREYREANGV